MIVVRPATATPLDLVWMLRELEQFAHAAATKRPLFPADPAHGAQLLTSLIEGGHPVLIATRTTEDGDEERLGLIAGHLSQHPYNPDLRVLTELFWWVALEHRATSAGARLLDAYIAAGRALADLVVMTLEHTSPISDRVLQKRGLRPFEHSYLLET